LSHTNRTKIGVQIIDEADQLKFGFDVLDPTKIIPEELVPVTPLGKLQLNQNPSNFFAETEQIMVLSITASLNKQWRILIRSTVPTSSRSPRHRLY
jgi:catalase